jgi:hypothetical protein
MRKLAVLTTALILSAAAPAHAACHFDLAMIHFGFENALQGQADSGKPCGLSGSTAGKAGVGSFQITQRPRHGVAGTGENGGMPVIAYRSAPGYRGPDEFVVAFVGGNARVPGQETSLHVYLDVR